MLGFLLFLEAALPAIAETCLFGHVYQPELQGAIRSMELTRPLCQIRCLATPRCVFFGYWPDHRCELYGHDAVLRDVRSSPGGDKVVAGTPTCHEKGEDNTPLPETKQDATCPGGFMMPGYHHVSMVPTGWKDLGEKVGDLEVLPGGELNVHMDARAYFADTCKAGHYNHQQYLALQLLGKTMRYTVDLSGAGCGCNAAFYLTSMRQNTRQSECFDYYCDANNVCGESCAEIDIQEGNMFAWHSTMHTSHDSGGKLAGWGGGAMDFDGTKYGPGAACIDTRKPFHVEASFPVDTAGSLAAMEVTLTQVGSACPVTAVVGDYQGMAEMTKALREGMTPIVSFWKSDDMLWLDGPGWGNSKGPCAQDNAASCPDTVKFSNFSVGLYVGKVWQAETTPPPALPTAATACVPRGQDCRTSQCCTEAGFQCYEKNVYWAACKKTCVAGIDPEDRKDERSPWTCRPMGVRTPTTLPPPTTLAPLTTVHPAVMPAITLPPTTTQPPTTTHTTTTTNPPPSRTDWMRENGLPMYPGNDLYLANSPAVSTLQDMKYECEQRQDCVGFAYLPSKKEWLPKVRNTGFNTATAVYEKQESGDWEWHYVEGRSNVRCAKLRNEDCTHTQCCFDAGMQCFEKNGYWAACQLNCTPGVDPKDLADQRTPWTCRPLGGRAPGTPNMTALRTALGEDDLHTEKAEEKAEKEHAEKEKEEEEKKEKSCSQVATDCTKSACCADPGLQCYTKNAFWAECREHCIPGSYGIDRHPWECKTLGPRTPGGHSSSRSTTMQNSRTTQSPTASTTTDSEEDPTASTIVTSFDEEDSTTTQFPENITDIRAHASDWVAKQGLPLVEGADLDLPLSHKRSTLLDMKYECARHPECVGFAYHPAKHEWRPKRRGTGFESATAAYTQKQRNEFWWWYYLDGRGHARCAAIRNEDCTQKQCCSDPGMQCFEKNAYWAACQVNCTPGIDPSDLPQERSPWTCRPLGSRTPGTPNVTALELIDRSFTGNEFIMKDSADSGMHAERRGSPGGTVAVQFLGGTLGAVAVLGGLILLVLHLRGRRGQGARRGSQRETVQVAWPPPPMERSGASCASLLALEEATRAVGPWTPRSSSVASLVAEGGSEAA
jgi:hypothetical protein